ncbi:hypothetical protein Pfra02_09130 [Pseudomonas fragi]|nr:hypothetical protein Pfra02_09130 [Pseudomonas fragi]
MSLRSLSSHEATIEREAAVDPVAKVSLTHRVQWFYDGYALERSLVSFVNGYTVRCNG